MTDGPYDSEHFAGHGVQAGRPRDLEVADEVPSGVEGLLDELVDIVATAKSMPLSGSVMVAREEMLELLKDRDEVIATARREAGEIIDDARVQSERMVQRTEIVRQAEYRAVRIVEDAEAEARRLRYEAEDYVDQRLAGFEIVLDRTMKTVRAGRERLAAVPADRQGGDPGSSGGASGPVGAGGGLSGISGIAGDQASEEELEGFFDQDLE
jgi:vacuolar-type H+-ATPase subunit H